jgi:uridine kinase
VGEPLARLGGGASAEGVCQKGLDGEEDLLDGKAVAEAEAIVLQALALLTARPMDRLLATCEELDRRSSALVAIDGPGGSGKTTLAAWIVGAAVGRSVVHVDDFYRPHPERSSASREDIGSSFDLARLREEVLVPLREGRPARFRPFDWDLDRLSEGHVDVEARALIVVDGVYTLHPDLAPFWDLTLFLDVPMDLCRKRVLARGENTTEEIDRWQAEERRYIQTFRPMERADHVLRAEDVVELG